MPVVWPNYLAAPIPQLMPALTRAHSVGVAESGYHRR